MAHDAATYFVQKKTAGFFGQSNWGRLRADPWSPHGKRLAQFGKSHRQTEATMLRCTCPQVKRSSPLYPDKIVFNCLAVAQSFGCPSSRYRSNTGGWCIVTMVGLPSWASSVSLRKAQGFIGKVTMGATSHAAVQANYCKVAKVQSPIDRALKLASMTDPRSTHASQPHRHGCRELARYGRSSGSISVRNR